MGIFKSLLLTYPLSQQGLPGTVMKSEINKEILQLNLSVVGGGFM